MRSHATEGIIVLTAVIVCRFNTASGMRSHVTVRLYDTWEWKERFQYRKRYEITCDIKGLEKKSTGFSFQYRKRYEITCDSEWNHYPARYDQVSIPQAV